MMSREELLWAETGNLGCTQDLEVNLPIKREGIRIEAGKEIQKEV